MSWVYKIEEPKLASLPRFRFNIGYFEPRGKFAEQFFLEDEGEAMQLVNYLNGGTGEPVQFLHERWEAAKKMR